MRKIDYETLEYLVLFFVRELYTPTCAMVGERFDILPSSSHGRFKSLQEQGFVKHSSRKTGAFGSHRSVATYVLTQAGLKQFGMTVGPVIYDERLGVAK